jgi:hypothetical protein
MAEKSDAELARQREEAARFFASMPSYDEEAFRAELARDPVGETIPVPDWLEIPQELPPNAALIAYRKDGSRFRVAWSIDTLQPKFQNWLVQTAINMHAECSRDPDFDCVRIATLPPPRVTPELIKAEASRRINDPKTGWPLWRMENIRDDFGPDSEEYKAARAGINAIRARSNELEALLASGAELQDFRDDRWWPPHELPAA